MPTKEYLIDRILPRPRDLLFFVKAALSIAVNRRHSKVCADDIEEAEKEYSQYALDSILVENGMTVHQIQRVIYEFMGCQKCLEGQDIENFFDKAGLDRDQHPYVLERLCALSFLGVEVSASEFRFVKDQDPQEFSKNEVLARKLVAVRGGNARYMVNKPFWAYLEVPQA